MEKPATNQRLGKIFLKPVRERFDIYCQRLLIVLPHTEEGTLGKKRIKPYAGLCWPILGAGAAGPFAHNHSMNLSNLAAKMVAVKTAPNFMALPYELRMAEATTLMYAIITNPESPTSNSVLTDVPAFKGEKLLSLNNSA